MKRKMMMLNGVSDAESYIDYIRRQYNSEFRVEYPYTLMHLEEAFCKYGIELENYELMKMDYVAYDCDHDLYAIIKFPTDEDVLGYRISKDGFEYRICEC